jgi:hypothetical protein
MGEFVAPYLLSAIIVVSALGALIVSLVVARYGLPTGDEGPETAARRLLATRVGHAAAAVCFAAVAILAVVALRIRMPPSAPTPPAASASGPADVAEARDAFRRSEPPVPGDLDAPEERLGSAAGEATVPPEAAAPWPETTIPPPAPSPPRPPARSRLPAPPVAVTLPDDEGPAAPATGGLTRHVEATVHGVRVDVQARPGGRTETLYRIRLSDTAGRPLVGADVSLHGRVADGAPLHVGLGPGREPGVYRGRVTTGPGGAEGLRLRVAARDKRFDLSLAHGVSW